MEKQERQTRQSKPVAHIEPETEERLIEPETEERLEEAYGPAMEDPVETVISKEQKEQRADLPGQEQGGRSH